MMMKIIQCGDDCIRMRRKKRIKTDNVNDTSTGKEDRDCLCVSTLVQETVLSEREREREREKDAA